MRPNEEEARAYQRPGYGIPSSPCLCSPSPSRCSIPPHNSQPTFNGALAHAARIYNRRNVYTDDTWHALMTWQVSVLMMSCVSISAESLRSFASTVTRTRTLHPFAETPLKDTCIHSRLSVGGRARRYPLSFRRARARLGSRPNSRRRAVAAALPLALRAPAGRAM